MRISIEMSLSESTRVEQALVNSNLISRRTAILTLGLRGDSVSIDLTEEQALAALDNFIRDKKIADRVRYERVKARRHRETLKRLGYPAEPPTPKGDDPE